MKIILALTLTLGFSIGALAADATPSQGINQQAPGGESPGADTYDGNELENPGEVGGKAIRAPNSGDLPYTDDEIQHNSPEGFKTKNMPIDQD